MASLRSGGGYAAFAGTKAGLRILAQSMAREFGPKNIHVAHSIIDGPIDTDFIPRRIPDIDAARADDNVLCPPCHTQLCHVPPTGAQCLDPRIGPARLGRDVLMMPTTLKSIFDFGSRNAYLAHRVMPDLLARSGATMKITPCLLGDRFKATGNASPMVQYASIPANLPMRISRCGASSPRTPSTSSELTPTSSSTP